MPKLSLCMIVKDEEANLARCLSSVAGAVDEIIVVDTGSRDRTIEVARQFGATVVEWAWRDDFGAARNISLERATGDWVLYLDADEELYREDREALRCLLDDETKEGYFLLEMNFAGDRPGFDVVTNPTLRLFRRKPEYRFEGAIHEQIMPAILSRGGRLGQSAVRIRHYGYLNGAITSQDKIERNLRIAKAEVKRRPKSAFALFNLGMEYLRMGEHESALAANRQAFLHLPDLTAQYASRLLRNIVASLIALKRYDEALKVLADGTEAYPDFTDLFYQQGLVYLEQKAYPQAAQAFQLCLDKGESHTRYISDNGVGSYRAHFGLGCALEFMGDFRGAVAAYEAALRECAVLPGPAYRLAGVLLKVAAPDQVLGNMLRLIDQGDPGSLSALAVAFKEARHYRHALALVDQSLSLAPDKSRLLLKGELLLHLGQYRESAEILAGVAGNGGSGGVFLALALIMAGDYPGAEAVLRAGHAACGEEGWTTVLGLFATLLTGETLGGDISLLGAEEQERVKEPIWKLLGFLLETREFDKFEQALDLLRLVDLPRRTRSLQLGKLYYALGFEESAVEELAGLSPAELDAEAAEILARILDRQGLEEEGLAFYQAALERDTGNPLRYALLAARAIDLGRWPLAGETIRVGLQRFPGNAGLESLADRLASKSAGAMTPGAGVGTVRR